MRNAGEGSGLQPTNSLSCYRAVDFVARQYFDFNRLSVPGWQLNNKLLKRRRFSRIQLKFMDTILPLFRHLEWIWPWRGLSLIGIAIKDN